MNSSVETRRRKVIPSDLAQVPTLQEEIELVLQGHFSETELFGIRMAIEECLVNAIKHGNQMDPAKQVHVDYHLATDRFDIAIRDEGPGFDPADVPDPTAPENLERPCGRGLLLMRSFMSEVNYNGSGNEVRMSKVKK